MPYDPHGNWYEDEYLPVPGDPGYDPGPAPPNAHWDYDAGQWVNHAPGSEGYDPTYGGYSTGDPNTDPWLKSVYEHQGWALPGGQAPGGGPATTTPQPQGSGLPQYGGPLRPNYQIPAWSGSSRPSYDIPDVPTFEFGEALPVFEFDETLPEFQFEYEKFKAPTAEEAAAEPGYRMALDESLGALTANKAAQGIVRTGGTLKDFIKYANNFASQNYAGVYARAADTHERNFRGAFDVARTQHGSKVDKVRHNLDTAYRKHGSLVDGVRLRFDTARTNYDGLLRGFGARAEAAMRSGDAEFANRGMQWQTQANAAMRAADQEWQRAWDKYVFETDDAYRRERDVLDRGML